MSRYKRTGRPNGRPPALRHAEDTDAPLTAPPGLRVLERMFHPKPVPFKLSFADIVRIVSRLEGRQVPSGTPYRWKNHGVRLPDGSFHKLPVYRGTHLFVLAEDLENFLAMRSGTDVAVKLPQDVADAATKAGRKLETMGV